MSEWPHGYSEKFASVSPRLKSPKRMSEVAGFLRTHMTSEVAVVIDDHNVESNLVVAAAGMPILPA